MKYLKSYVHLDFQDSCFTFSLYQVEMYKSLQFVTHSLVLLSLKRCRFQCKESEYKMIKCFRCSVMLMFEFHYQKVIISEMMWAWGCTNKTLHPILKTHPTNPIVTTNSR